MIDLIFALIAAASPPAQEGDAAARAATTAQATAQPSAQATSPSVIIGENVSIGSGVVVNGATSGNMAGTTAQVDTGQQDTEQKNRGQAASASGFDMSVVPAGLQAEPQEVLGKFTTATEIRPIMDVTRKQWIGVREYNGQDLVYVTHLWGWRCGMKAVALSVNGDALQDWPLPPCHMKYTTPNAILEEDGLPFKAFPLGSVTQVDVQIVYDDLSIDAQSYQRGDVLIP